MIDLDKYLKTGKSFHFLWGGLTNHYHLELWHIRAVVDDCQYVYRYWSYTKRQWIYGITDRSFFEVFNKNGLLFE